MTSNYPPGVTGAEPQIAGEAETLSDRIREWDDMIEEQGGDTDARKPFDAGIMLAVATVLERWETGDLAEAVRLLAETAEAVIEGYEPELDES